MSAPPEPTAKLEPNRAVEEARAPWKALTVAYLINQYPQSSQSFIRREIASLEKLGVRIERFTVRRWNEKLVDPQDQAEQQKTRAVLESGTIGSMIALLRALLTHPLKFIAALKVALKIGWRSDRGPLLHLVYLAEACVMLPWLRDCGARHVHAHFGTNSTTVAMLCHILGGPTYSFTCHGPEEFDRPNAIALGEKIRRAAFVIAISEFGRSQIYRWCESSHWNKVHVVHCGLDQQFLGRPTMPPPREPRLVCVGRLSEQKGQLLLINAAAMLAADRIIFELILVGDGPMRRDVEAMIAEHQLSSRVRITGWMSNEQVRDQISSCRAMVLASFAEGLPVVIMEAFALGRPVISTYVAGIPELVKNNESGWLVPAGDVNALARAMQQALSASPDDLNRMGKAGAQAVASRHDASIEAEKLATLFANQISTSSS